MISFILGALTLPSSFYASIYIEDYIYTKIYSDSGMKVLNVTKKKKMDEKGENFYDLPLEKQFHRFISFSVPKTAIISSVPIYRHAFYFSSAKGNTTIELLTESFNQKIECEHCKLVQAFWNFKTTQDNLGICPNCENITIFNIVDGDDEDYPFFKRKTKKDIKNMLLQTEKDIINSSKEKKLSVREEQLKIKEKYNSSDKHIDL